MKILVTNIYSWRNKGDAAIILALMDHLKEEFPEASVSLSSYDVDDKGRYGPYPCYENFLTLLRRSYGKNYDTLWGRFYYAAGCLMFYFCLALFCSLQKHRISWYWLFSADFVEKLRAYENCDLVVACGGGYLLSRGRARMLERLLGYNHLRFISLDFYAAKCYSKPFVLYNQSIGPFFSDGDRRVVGRCLKDAALVICREALSYDRLREMGLKNIELSSDAAFRLKAVPCGILDDYGFGEQNTNIGITIRQCLAGEKQENFEKEFADFIETLLKMHPDCRFYFMPQVIYTQAGDDDREVAERVRSRLSGQSQQHVAIIKEDLHPGALKQIIAQMDYFVGTRMHSNIFALSSMVRTIAVAYEPKTTGIMKMLGLEEYVIDADSLDHRRMIELWECLVRDPGYVETLRGKILEIQKLSRVNLKDRLKGLIPETQGHARPYSVKAS